MTRFSNRNRRAIGTGGVSINRSRKKFILFSPVTEGCQQVYYTVCLEAKERVLTHQVLIAGLEDPMDKDRSEEILKQCTHFLGGHGSPKPADVLAELAQSADPELKTDHYGAGEVIENFEKEAALLLGKDQAVFMPSGTMCQQIALRLWSERRKSPHIAFHPKCHLEIHEQKAYQMLLGLHGVLVGHPDQLMTLEDLKKVKEPLAALLIELPQREIGGQLPSWDELQSICAWGREQGIAMHMDGARLWESGPFYGREYREIAALFDSVYVSFYKGLGGLAGSILAGPEDLIAEARIWQRRYGGNLIRLFPYVLSAQQGLRKRLPRMQSYHEKALEIAEILAEFPEVEVVPNPPQTNMMHIYFRGERRRLEEAALQVAEETKIWLFKLLGPSPLPHYQKYELSVGDSTIDLSREQIAEVFRLLLSKASAKTA
jgi:threonine aldolase